MGLRFSRWIFSISAIATAASSGTSLMMTGMVSRPASWQARQRRSPATISYLLLLMGRTTIGCMTPWARMELARSSRDSGCMSWRGWYLPGWMNSTGRFFNRLSWAAAGASDSAWAGAEGLSLGCEAPVLPDPSRASSPLPRPLFLIVMVLPPSAASKLLGNRVVVQACFCRAIRCGSGRFAAVF